MAIDQKLFTDRGLTIEPVRFDTANQITEALVANRIDATSVSADFPFLTMAQRARMHLERLSKKTEVTRKSPHGHFIGVWLLQIYRRSKRLDAK